jgi:predicted nucleotidyltransferase
MLTFVPTLGTIVPIMGTQSETGIAATLLGRARAAVLAVLLRDPEKSMYFREIVRAAGVGHGAAQRELANLVAAGIALRTRRGNQVFYQANRQSPVFREIRSLVVKTAGVADELRRTLGSLGERIRVAFVFGSIARGTDRPGSDIDVMIVGELTLGEAVGAVSESQDVLGREINPSVFGVEEFARKAAASDHFVSSVLGEPKVFLIGGEDELRGLAGEGMADTSQDEQAGDR